jgi:hypothetical protein
VEAAALGTPAARTPAPPAPAASVPDPRPPASPEKAAPAAAPAPERGFDLRGKLQQDWNTIRREFESGEVDVRRALDHAWRRVRRLLGP